MNFFNFDQNKKNSVFLIIHLPVTKCKSFRKITDRIKLYQPKSIEISCKKNEKTLTSFRLTKVSEKSIDTYKKLWCNFELFTSKKFQIDVPP